MRIQPALTPSPINVVHWTTTRSACPAVFSPPVVMERLATRQGLVWVAREDVLPGGTKQRAAIPFLAQKMAAGRRDFAFASPFAGFAQVAMAVACHALGARCTLYCEADRSAPRGSDLELHPFSLLAEAYGAHVKLMPTLSDAEAAADAHAFGRADAYRVPLGFDCEEYRAAFARELRSMWPVMCDAMEGEPTTLWVALGTGTLATTLRDVIGVDVRLRCLDVGMLPAGDARIAKVASLPNTTVERVPELFEEPARLLPPIASNTHYDAKVWPQLHDEGGARDLWWNVAR